MPSLRLLILGFWSRFIKSLSVRINSLTIPCSKVGWTYYAAIFLAFSAGWLSLSDYALHKSVWVSPHTPSVLGFQRMAPQKEGISLSYDGNFKVLFRNELGWKLMLYTDTASVRGTNRTEGLCRSINFEPRSVKPGGTFSLIGRGCPKGNPGDLYNMKVYVPGSINVEGGITNYFEEGSMRGLYE
jgi:hypothetical protein